MLLGIKMAANTVGGVMLGDIPKVFTHPFTQCSFSVTNILFMARIINEHSGSQLSLEGCENHRK